MCGRFTITLDPADLQQECRHQERCGEGDPTDHHGDVVGFGDEPALGVLPALGVEPGVEPGDEPVAEGVGAGGSTESRGLVARLR